MFRAPATSFSVPPNYTFFIYKQPVYKQLGLELQLLGLKILGLKILGLKMLGLKILGLKNVTISNFAKKIFAYENIATTLHNHISVYYIYNVILFSDFIR